MKSLKFAEKVSSDTDTIDLSIWSNSFPMTRFNLQVTYSFVPKVNTASPKLPCLDFVLTIWGSFFSYSMFWTPFCSGDKKVHANGLSL